jgi:hypothetical protein
MSPFREIAVLPPQSQNRQSADIARKQRSTARLQTDARPSRDGSERFGSGTQAYGFTAKFQPAAWSWAQNPNDERFRCPKTRFECEEAITFKLQRPN